MPGPISLLFPETRSVTAVRELAVRTEAQGFRGMELGAAFGFDPIMALAAAGPATSELLLGVAVVPTWPRHPVVMAQQAATASALTGGRFRLGVGPSHEPVMGMYGIDASRPLGHLEDYLTIVQGLLHQGNVRHKGERYRVTAFLDVADAPPPPVRLAVLRPRMCRLAGRLADGALPWLTPAAYVADVVVPGVAAGAAEAGRPAPPVLAELPCALATSRDEVRAMAATDLAIYPMMPNYRAMWQAAGIEPPEQGWSDEMIDASILWGDEDRLAAGIDELLAAGAAEVVLSPFGVGDDPTASQARLINVLADVNRSRT